MSHSKQKRQEGKGTVEAIYKAPLSIFLSGPSNEIAFHPNTERLCVAISREHIESPLSTPLHYVKLFAFFDIADSIIRTWWWNLIGHSPQTI